jgi:hypothetical protein
MGKSSGRKRKEVCQKGFTLMAGEITGVEETIRAIGKARSEDAIRISDGLQKCGDVILRKALMYCPKDTGKMAETGKVEVSGSGFGAKVDVVFGGSGAPYTLYVHEDLEAQHKPPTCAQWLTRATRETRGTCSSIMRRTLTGSSTKLVNGQAVK